jgi:hypothetical protein
MVACADPVTCNGVHVALIEKNDFMRQAKILTEAGISSD